LWQTLFAKVYAASRAAEKSSEFCKYAHFGKVVPVPGAVWNEDGALYSLITDI
jgi:hypothetical protein